MDRRMDTCLAAIWPSVRRLAPSVRYGRSAVVAEYRGVPGVMVEDRYAVSRNPFLFPPLDCRGFLLL